MMQNFHDKFYTDLNYMIRENGSLVWYVLAYRQPDLPYRTLYHLPNDLATNRNCYSYLLSTQFGVIVMDFICHGKESLHSYDILTQPDGTYVTSQKYPQQATDFRMVHVLRLTKTIVLLVSCSFAMDTYGVLVLHRGPWLPAQDEAYFHGIIIAKFPAPMHRWMNFTMTSVSAAQGTRAFVLIGRCRSDAILQSAFYATARVHRVALLTVTISVLSTAAVPNP
uniref:Uncharacterized protein n=1 Tax=Anopheles atroparvus TaxID=41427 RepID=A0A182JKI5_ANOAO